MGKGKVTEGQEKRTEKEWKDRRRERRGQRREGHIIQLGHCERSHSPAGLDGQQPLLQKRAEVDPDVHGDGVGFL